MQDDTYLARLCIYRNRRSAFPRIAKLCKIIGLSCTSSVCALVAWLVAAG